MKYSLTAVAALLALSIVMTSPAMAAEDKMSLVKEDFSSEEAFTGGVDLGVDVLTLSGTQATSATQSTAATTTSDSTCGTCTCPSKCTKPNGTVVTFQVGPNSHTTKSECTKFEERREDSCGKSYDCTFTAHTHP